MRTNAILLLTLLLSTHQFVAQVAHSANLSLSDASKSWLVGQYLEAFNCGETAMIAFWQRSSISDLPLSLRLQRYRTMRSDLGTITMLSALPESLDGLDVVVQSSHGQRLQMTFLMTKDANPKISGIRLQPEGEGSPAGPSGNPEVSIEPESENVVLDRIRQLVQGKSKADAFSGAILIARGPEVIWENAYGMADRNFKIPNQVNTRFDTGSIAKTFTKVAIAQLIEQGKLDLEDTLGKYVPDYPNEIAKKKVTVGELIDMTSGIGDVFGPKLDKTRVGDIRSLSDYLPLFDSEPLAFEPGSKHAYSNGGYILLGLIIEKITGRSYYDYVQEHIFQPAGMKDTDFPFSDMPHDNEATGYTRMTDNSQPSASVPAPLRTNVLMMPARGCSAGSARTTARDLFVYSRALTNETLLKKSTADRIGISGSAMGIGGGGPGINAGIETGIHGAGSADYTIVVMSNYDPPSAVDLMREIRAMLRTAK